MPTVILVGPLARWFDPAATAPTGERRVTVCGNTVREALDSLFQMHPFLRGYVLDDQQAVRGHVAVFVDNAVVPDKRNLNHPISNDSEIYIVQALSGG